MIDLRSDTLTQPTADMRIAMANAPVGDDVIDVDPTVEELQNEVARLLGKEAAMFMPSGTMTNQVAVRLHCRPGDEFLCEEGCHILNYEQGGFAQLSQVVARPIVGCDGTLSLEQLQDVIRPNNEHATQTRMLALENTHNRAGGTIAPLANLRELCAWARSHGLKTHLDGARLWNAIVATGVPADQWAESFDTVSVCFSKGLGAPVGSALVGNREMLPAMRRHRKLFGGGMRQAGIIAAGALYALRNHMQRLADDHRRAQQIASHIAQVPGLRAPARCDTNIVIFDVEPQLGTAAAFCEAARQAEVWMFPFGQQRVRAVTHLHITSDDAAEASERIAATARKLAHR